VTGHQKAQSHVTQEVGEGKTGQPGMTSQVLEVSGQEASGPKTADIELQLGRAPKLSKDKLRSLGCGRHLYSECSYLKE
jgi:hypothetical protein